MPANEQKPAAFEVAREDVRLAGEAGGEGPPVVLLHGLTATRRYVVMGSRKLERSGYRLVAYDARGHGESSPPAERSAYEYGDLVGDLAALLDELALERPVLAGASMGAHTAMAYALENADRLSALVQITPAYTYPRADDDELRNWEELAAGLERDGIDGFCRAWQPRVHERWRETAVKVVRQRLARHRDLRAVADALRVVPRSVPFDGLDELEWMELPTLVVASRDEADPEHPLSVAEAYAQRLPNAQLVVEDEGASPVAWQGARLSGEIARFLERAVRGRA